MDVSGISSKITYKGNVLLKTNTAKYILNAQRANFCKHEGEKTYIVYGKNSFNFDDGEEKLLVAYTAVKDGCDAELI